MSQENVELVKALYPEPDTEVTQLFRDDEAFAQLREALSPLITGDFESVMHGGFIQDRTHTGLEGFRRNWLDWLEPWETYRSTIDELIDAGDDVVLLLRDYGRRKGTDREVELIGASVATFREGKLARWRDYADRAEALEAVGLRESAMSQENVEVVLTQFEDLDTRDPKTLEAAWADSAVLRLHGDLGAIGKQTTEAAAVGKDAVMKYFSDWFAAFDRRYHFEIHETRYVGDRVLVDATHHAFGRASGAPVTHRMAWVFTVQGGKLERCDVYTARDEALEAVGLQE